MSPGWSLFFAHPDGKRVEFALQDGLRVGRSPECEVRVANAFLSRVHFTIVASGDGFAVTSNHRHTARGGGSTGAVLGTYLNDEKVLGTRMLKPGDRLSPVAEPTAEHPIFEIGPTVDPLPPGTDSRPKRKGFFASLFGG
ncbi:MAG: FHA domain-containing protein [Myxococcota bacterium]